jgi:predicted nucleic acid-binding protein
MKIPSSGKIWLDANALIYSVEQVSPYWSILRQTWDAEAKGELELHGSELLLLEAFVLPLKDVNRSLIERYEQVLATGVRLAAISKSILRRASELRASQNLKTPDAIHAASALDARCDAFVTNDPGFRRVPGLPVILLDDLINP